MHVTMFSDNLSAFEKVLLEITMFRFYCSLYSIFFGFLKTLQWCTPLKAEAIDLN